MSSTSRRSGRSMRPGLTLPELLIAIAVLGVLGAMLLARHIAPPPTPSIAIAEPVSPEPEAPVPEPEESPDPTNLLVNGSFEAPDVHGARYVTFHHSIPGWRIRCGTVDVKSTYWRNAPAQGSQSLDMVGSPGAATIEQTFRTEPGKLYTFSGWMAHNPIHPYCDEGRIQISLNGKEHSLVHRARTSVSDMRWKRFEIPFRAAAPTTTLSIRDTTPRAVHWGTALDGLAVRPAPPTCGLTIPGPR